MEISCPFEREEKEKKSASYAFENNFCLKWLESEICEEGPETSWRNMSIAVFINSNTCPNMESQKQIGKEIV